MFFDPSVTPLDSVTFQTEVVVLPSDGAAITLLSSHHGDAVQHPTRFAPVSARGALTEAFRFRNAYAARPYIPPWWPTAEILVSQRWVSETCSTPPHSAAAAVTANSTAAAPTHCLSTNQATLQTNEPPPPGH